MHIKDYVNTGEDGVVIARRGERAAVAVSANETEAVGMAVADLIRDLASVSGAELNTTANAAEANLVIGTIGTSEIIDDAIEQGLLDIEELKDEHGEWRWESYTLQTVDSKVYIAGVSRRATIYGIYDLVEAAGVSPWYWWADIPVRHADAIVVNRNAKVFEWPAVQYRGVFINDEEEFYDWACTHTSDGTIGPETYRHFFELVLRLKGNYVWPAMHVGAFGDDPRNGDLAERMGIVIGTTHCDMLMRSNQHEWDPWVKAQGEEVKYDYSIEGHNREKIQQYWREGVQRNHDHEVTWTVGMRGIHDTGFVTRAIDGDMHLSEEQKHRARVDLLGKVIADQRRILHEELGDRADKDLQLFVPYKEVLPLYDDGLELPDDITILWANDNYGYMRRFPSLAERKRKGGHGLYYHSSYWAPTDSYLATSSTPFTLMKNELKKSWDNGIRKMWIDNIGGLKPMEQEMEYFLYLAWNAGTVEYDTDVNDYTAAWIDRNFSGGIGREAAALYTRYYQLNNERKPENLEVGAFSQTAYGDEFGHRVEELHKLYDQANALWLSLPENERDAFFETYLVKLHFSYLVNAQFYHADRSLLAEHQGKTAAQDEQLALSRRFELQKRALIEYYNKHLAGGKWDRMFTPDDFPPPATALNPAARPALHAGEAGLGVTVWGAQVPGDDVLDFWPDGVADKWIEVFSTGRAGLAYEAVANQPWIHLGNARGTLSSEVRIGVNVDANEVAAGSAGTVTVRVPATGQSRTISVNVIAAARPSSDFDGSVEADGYVSIDPSRPDERQDGERSHWQYVEHLGRFGNAVLEANSGIEATSADPKTDPAYVGYRFWLTEAAVPQLELHRVPSLDSTGQIRVGVSVDGSPIVELGTETVDEHIGDWENSKLDNIDRVRTFLPHLSAGAHVLRLYVIDSYAAYDKIVLYTTERKASNLGPDFSYHTGRGHVQSKITVPAPNAAAELDRDLCDFYHLEAEQVPLPRVGVIGKHYWDTDTTFKRFTVRTQKALGAARYPVATTDGKDLLDYVPAESPREHDGVLAFEAETALLNSEAAWTTPSLDGKGEWRHVQSETDGGTGLAMRSEPAGLEWDAVSWKADEAPRISYRVNISTPGTYRVWLYAEVDSKFQDMVWLSVDGKVQPAAEHSSGRGLWAFGLRYIWHWTELSSVDLTVGTHEIAFLAGNGGVRIDRVYMTQGEEEPPLDAQWSVTV
ncbi:glycosyl hydrolase 115 family protein [Bifidobacterium sp. UTBIF-78]|uniref:glycosyl hydrolase 115 family protein n=1 Tax=Bifidobacterium sp. UTBIF-78 TaxID=1465263 RepID=UPI00112CE08A|nr:glycosyl hydrolase 115 family protein [Bifidobacterium sp. UTBIF-78]